MYHEHPLKILKNASKNIWLLIFPLLRGIKTMRLDFDVFYNWISGAWFDILVIVIIIGFGYLRWIFTWFRFGENDVSLMSGILIKRETSIPYESISAVTAKHSFFLRPFKAVNVSVDTCAGAFNSPDMLLLMKRKDLLKLHHISKDLLENELKEAFSQLTSELSSKFALSIPPAAITLAILIIVTWLFSFILNILRYAGFVMKKDKQSLEIRMGTITRRNFHIVTHKINYIDMRQSIIMKIFRKTSLNISCSGYGNEKNELPVLLPILSRRQSNSALDILDFGKRIGRRTISSLKSAVITFIGIPLYFCLGIPIAAKILVYFIPSIYQFVLFFAIMAEIPSIWMLIIKIVALFTTGVSIEDDFISIRYSRFFAFHTVLADKSKIVKIQIIQNPIQKKLGRCRLDFYFNSEVAKKNKLHGISIKDAEWLLKILNI